ncbi:sensor histidine kinase [Peterkaempfera griseoplana]|uniref:sensor histidine kinase n=1 Tax=Peterkaempfera griseoplana TaxID=66896 RepID=UPI0006E397B8|nr:sensor histidine kinase [Peterkaempfera griseoplana]
MDVTACRAVPATPGRTPAARGFTLLLTRWAAAAGRLRLRVLDERYPTAVDFACALALLALTAAPQHRLLAAHPWLTLFHLGLVLPLGLRRRAPYAVFGVMAAVAFVQWLTTSGMPADMAVLFALYTVAAHCPRRRTLTAFAVAELGVVLLMLRWGPPPPYGNTLAFAARLFLLLSGTTLAALVLGLNVRARRAQLAALHQRARELELQRDQRAALAVAEERSRIAREMHDIVTHNLSVMVALADGAVYANPHAPQRATAAMRQSAETGRQALTDMRRFLGVLRADEPDALRHPQPGLGQLPALVAQVEAAGLPTGLAVTGSPAAVPPSAQLTVYRLVQESLTNTLKHAAPGARAQVRVDCSAGAVELSVEDDGRPLRAADGHSGQGVAGMRERAAAYGGELHAGPLPGGGWRVAVTLDLGPRPADPEELTSG